MVTRIIETKILLLSIIGILFAELATALVIQEVSFSPMLILGVARLLETLLFFILVSAWGKGMSSIGLGRDTIIPGLKKGLIWSAVFAICTFLGLVVLLAAHIDPFKIIRSNLPLKTQELLLFFLVGSLVGPVAEEVFFRGIIYGFLRRWGVPSAVTGTTVIFVIPHLASTGLPLTQIAGGIVFALAYEIGGSLMVPITIHVLGNAAIFAISLMT